VPTLSQHTVPFHSATSQRRSEANLAFAMTAVLAVAAGGDFSFCPWS